MRIRDLQVALALVLAAPAVGTAQSVSVVGVAQVGGRPVEGVVVYLDTEGPLGEDRDTAGTAVIDQDHLRFSPKVVVVRPGTTVDFLNSDPILHSVFSPGWSGEEFDLGTYPSGTSRSHTFTEPGVHVVLCHVHPEMSAHVLVLATPFHAVSDAEGRFRITDVPPGPYRIHVWQRGAELRDQELVVPLGGVTELLLDLSHPDHLLVRARW